MSWVNDLRRILDGEACVLVTLNQLIGSAPRESGSRMVVTRAGIAGSIGGGKSQDIHDLKSKIKQKTVNYWEP